MKSFIFALALLASSVSFAGEKSQVQSAEQKSPQQKSAVQKDAAQKSDTLAREGWRARRAVRTCRSGSCR